MKNLLLLVFILAFIECKAQEIEFGDRNITIEMNVSQDNDTIFAKLTNKSGNVLYIYPKLGAYHNIFTGKLIVLYFDVNSIGDCNENYILIKLSPKSEYIYKIIQDKTVVTLKEKEETVSEVFVPYMTSNSFEKYSRYDEHLGCKVIYCLDFIANSEAVFMSFSPR